MNPLDAFVVGIAPQHLPALIAALALPFVVLGVRRLRAHSPHAVTGVTPPRSLHAITVRRPHGITVRRPHGITADLVAAWLLGIAAAVHLALPLGHVDGPVLTIAFLGSGLAYAWLAMRAFEGRSWRAISAPLLVATLLGYLITMGAGGEEPDQVGIATALVELAALGLCLVPLRTPGRPRRFGRFVASVATVTVTLLVGAAIWVQFFQSHAGAQAAPAGAAPADPARGALGPTLGHNHDGGHAHAARAQAGVVMRPPSLQPPTFAQAQAARDLAEATAAAARSFATLDAARAAGYVAAIAGDGMDVHFENAAYKSDGRVLDPQRPEQLVYAVAGGRATLLGVVFVMERGGAPGPEPGGSITRWHAHNLCLTLLPPGVGVVTPFGNCPALSVSVTVAEMMHVWIVDNPAGAYAEGLDPTWVRAYHARHGIAYSPR